MDSSSVDFTTVKNVVVTQAVPLALRVAGAILLWVVGRWVIAMIRRGLRAASEARKVDTTLVRYTDSSAHVVLSLLLVLAVLSVFGVETTSFAGILAAAGVAVGIAWSGLLSNFAAGVFILGLEPFRVGDLVGIGGVSGTVQQIGMFNTAVDTGENVRTWIGNARIFAENIQNFSANGWRRAEVLVPVPKEVDLLSAIVALKELGAKVPGVMEHPAPTADVTAVYGNGVLALRVAVPPARHAAVQAELNRLVVLWLKSRAAPAPQPAQVAAAS